MSFKPGQRKAVANPISGLATYSNTGQIGEASDFYSDYFKVIKLPHSLRNRFHGAFGLAIIVDPEKEFANQFESFPLRVVVSPLEHSKGITRLDNLQAQEGNAIVELFNKHLQAVDSHVDGRVLCMLLRLPFCKEKALYVMHNLDAVGTNLFECDGPIYSFWTQDQDRVKYRLYMQKARDFFGWDYMSSAIKAYIGETEVIDASE